MSDIRFFCNCEEGKLKLEYSVARAQNPTIFFEVNDEICEHCGYYTRAECDVPKNKNDNDTEFELYLDREIYESFDNDDDDDFNY